MDKRAVYQELKKLLNRAYSQYSQVQVASAICYEVDGQEQYSFGVNVENASYGLTQCAERTAVCSAVVAGMQKLKAVYLLSNLDRVITPCGACRQVLAEFSVHPQVPVVCFDLQGEERQFSVAELLPHSFSLAE